GWFRLLVAAAAVVGAAEVVLASAGVVSAADGAAGVTTASVSCTGRAAGVADAASGAAMLVTLFRVARYPPTPAAPMQAAASAAKVRRFETMKNLSPSGTDTS